MNTVMQLRSAVSALRYCGAFIILATIPLLYQLGTFAPLATLALILFVTLIGENMPPHEVKDSGIIQPGIARLLPIIYIPAQLSVITWGGLIIARAGSNASEIAALAIPIGVTTGIFGVLAAHEMLHSRKILEQYWGGLLLLAICYRHFRIAHIYGHHRLAGTEWDSSTAKEGENFYAFLIRTLRGQIAFSWSFEQRRCRSRRYSWLRNRCLHDLCAAFFLCALMTIILGKAALAFFLIQSAVAILILELFNYVAHYGLFRRRDVMGALEPFGSRHAWNMSAPLANLLLLNMGRHSDHHRRAAAPYQTLQPLPQSPELPAGYAGSILMALIPPLWRYVMDKKIASVMSSGIAPHTA